MTWQEAIIGGSGNVFTDLMGCPALGRRSVAGA